MPPLMLHLASLVGLLFLGIDTPVQPPPALSNSPLKASPEVSPLPAPPAELDVLRVVLADVQTRQYIPFNPTIDPPSEQREQGIPRRAGKRWLVIANCTSSLPANRVKSLAPLPLERDVDSAKYKIPTAICSELSKRLWEHNVTSVSLAGLVSPSSSDALQLGDLSLDNRSSYGHKLPVTDFDNPLHKRHPYATFALTPWRPVFSAEGQYALVHFGLIETPHGASGTYILERVRTPQGDVAWKIKWSQFSFYA